MAELRLLLWVYAISAGYVLAMLFRRRGVFHPRYAVLMALLLGVSAAGLILDGFSGIAFWAATAGFFLLLVIPGLTVRLGRRAARRGNFRQAHALCRVTYVLLPARGIWREREFYRAIVSGELPAEAADGVRSGLSTAPVRTPASLAILVAVLAVHVIVESLGSSDDHLTLLDFGALHGALAFSVEPWRLVTSMFLHAGLLHLFFNVGAIYVLGRWVEPDLGSARLILVYFLGGILGGVASVLSYGTDVLSVGASGGAMALVGCATALTLGARDQERRQRFSSLLLIIGATIAVGVMEPGIDNGAHVGGLVAGFLMGQFFKRVARLPDLPVRAAALTMVGVVCLSYYLLVTGFGGWRAPAPFECGDFSLRRPSLFKPTEEEGETTFLDPAIGKFTVSLIGGYDEPGSLVSMRLEEIEAAIRREVGDARLLLREPVPVAEPRNAWYGALRDESGSPGILYEVFVLTERSRSAMLTFTLPCGQDALRNAIVPGVVTSFQFD